MGIKCPNCNCGEYIESGLDNEIVMAKDKIYVEHELICVECGYEYGARFVFSEYIRWECE